VLHCRHCLYGSHLRTLLLSCFDIWALWESVTALFTLIPWVDRDAVCKRVVVNSTVNSFIILCESYLDLVVFILRKSKQYLLPSILLPSAHLYLVGLCNYKNTALGCCNAAALCPLDAMAHSLQGRNAANTSFLRSSSIPPSSTSLSGGLEPTSNLSTTSTRSFDVLAKWTPHRRVLRR